MPKQLLFGSIQLDDKAEGKQGRPLKQWADYVMDDLARLKLRYKWYKVAQDRSEWRNRIQQLLEHT